MTASTGTEAGGTRVTRFKGYWSVTKVSERLGVSAGTLRTWERLGKIAPAKRASERGWRRYDQAAVTEIERSLIAPPVVPLPRVRNRTK